VSVVNDGVPRSSTTIKGTLIICSFLIILVDIISVKSQAQGYELSIYSSTPTIWILLILVIGVLILALCHLVNSASRVAISTVIAGILLLVLGHLIVLNVPYIRGYAYIHGGDTLTHIGHVHDILINGHFTGLNSFDFYPITHIFIAQIHLIVGSSLSLNQIANASTPAMSLIYILGIYLLSKVLCNSKKEQITSVIIATVTFSIYSSAISPTGWSIYILPMIFYLIFEDSPKHKLLLVPLLVLLPFFHPLTTVVCALMLTMMLVLAFISSKLSFMKNYFDKIPSFRSSILYIALSLSLLIPWALSFDYLHKNIRRFASVIIDSTPESGSYLTAIEGKLDKLDIDIWGFLDLYLKTYGVNTIFAIMAIYSLLIILKTRQKKRKFEFFLVISIFLLIDLSYLLYILGLLPGLDAILFHRIIMFLVIFQPIISSFALQNIPYFQERKKILLIATIIVIISIITLLTLYQSPFVFRPSQHVTAAQLEGTEWFSLNKSYDIEYVEIMTSQVRRFDAIFGVNKRMERKDITGYAEKLPDHFNYSSNADLGSNYRKDTYAIITQFDKDAYTTVWDKVDRFDSEDFMKLSCDQSVSAIYNNGDVETWYINGLQRTYPRK
jgi:hypothetical protein